MFEIHDTGEYFDSAPTLKEAKELISRLDGDFRILDTDTNTIVVDYHYKGNSFFQD